MTTYRFGKGEFEGSDGSKASLNGISLDFDQKLESRPHGDGVAVALGDGELKITGKFESHEGKLYETGQIFFKTSTSNFGVVREVTIKLNHCIVSGNTFEAKTDKHGNVFTLSAEDQSSRESGQ